MEHASPQQSSSRVAEWAATLPAFLTAGLMVLWAAHDGGYDADTWYWSALAVLALLAVLIVGPGRRILELPRVTKLALAAFVAYVAWSYLSIIWASSPGDALQGSNRALLYLLVFGVFALTPWSPRPAFWILTAYALGIGVIGLLMLLRMADGGAVALFSQGRLVSPTGYFNSSAALFTIATLVSGALCVRKEVPAIVRGLLLAFACVDLQLALLAQSRGWLFTLPLVLVCAVAVVANRGRIAVAAIGVIVGLLANLSKLLDLFPAYGHTATAAPGFAAAAQTAGRTGLVIFAGLAIAGSLLAASEPRWPKIRFGAVTRRVLAICGVVLALGAAIAGALVATHGDPVGFVSRQWHGFSHESTNASTGSYFAVVGSGRYDIWRVAMNGFLAHPVGGLGQDNFADYYVLHRHTGEEPAWTHSIELRLLTQTGVVGLALFAAFMVLALTSAIRSRRRGSELARAVAGAAMLPLIAWLIHGSIDWFWEIPALSGPALGFLAMAGGLAAAQADERHRGKRLARVPTLAGLLAGTLAVLAAVVVLGLPYLSVREVSIASNIQRSNPNGALSALATASKLNPLSSGPSRLAGSIALQNGNFSIAEQRFRQAIAREPGGWFSWLGAGLAASALGDRAGAHHYFTVAESINSDQPAVSQALAQVHSRHPLTTAQAFKLIVNAQ
ncbi:MAG: O-antigen ligase family protein [Solirubrobacterales bacterium]|nr:O-antigen ligase family protein [Solirubrobacterales bacterium]